MYESDTIAAIATPAGSGGVGIVRVSGAAASDVATAVFRGAKTTATWHSHQLYAGHLVDTHAARLDAGLAVLMRGPNSYTGEDVLELHCHGSPLVLRAVLAVVLQAGARAARPGEFTKRAFLNGRIDLAQAEAVADLIGARSPAAAAAALTQLDGKLSTTLNELRSGIIASKALLEVQIDFSDEDVHIDPRQIAEQVAQSCQRLDGLIVTYERGRVLREGLRVALIGKPNVGKSSLMNALLGVDRAIVTAVAGTTRDTIEESLAFDGIPIVLIDTAGLRRDSNDTIEQIGMRRTQAALAQADVVVVVLDGSQSLDAADQAVLTATLDSRRVVALNKTDLGVCADATTQIVDLPSVAISATRGTGLDQLRRAVVAQVRADDRSADDLLITNARHAAALVAARRSLDLVLQSLRDGQPPDVVAVDVQDAIDHVGEITGLVSNEEVLDHIFSQFCIGK